MNTYWEITTSLIALSFFTLVVIKNIMEVKKNVKAETPWLKLLLSVTIPFALLPFGLVIIVIFMLYREIVRLILKLKHRSKFVGLVEGADAVHTTEGPETSIIKVLIVFEYQAQHSPQEFFEALKQTVHDLIFCNRSKLPKFHSVFHNSMGYTYMLKEKIKVEECIRKMKTVGSQDEEISKTELMKLLSECYNWPLPRNESILWDMLIGTQSIKWRKNAPSGVKYYPVMARIHHGVADGVSLLKLLAGVFADKANVKLVSSELYQEESTLKLYKNYSNNKSLTVKSLVEELITLFKHIWKIFKFAMISLYVVLLTPSSAFNNFVIKGNDKNIFHGPPLSGNKILAVNAEEYPEYIEKVKRIKNQIAKVSFSDIIFTALSASLKDYFQQNSKSHPEYITTAIPMLLGSEELQNIVPGHLNFSDVSLQNGYSLVLLNFPLCTKNDHSENRKTPLLDRLKLMKKETHTLKTSVDYHVNCLLMSVIFAILPQPLVRFILSGSHCTTVVSIIAGPPKISYGGGTLPMSDFAFWVPHLKNTGVSFSVMTYDQKMYVGISVDEALVPHQKDAQGIIDGVYKYLDLLDDEVEKCAKID